MNWGATWVISSRLAPELKHDHPLCKSLVIVESGAIREYLTDFQMSFSVAVLLANSDAAGQWSRLAACQHSANP
jgi:hypothetical protein